MTNNTFLDDLQSLLPIETLSPVFAYNIASFYEQLNVPKESLRIFQEVEARCVEGERLHAMAQYRIAMLMINSFL